jgi:hypothetical protein
MFDSSTEKTKSVSESTQQFQQTFLFQGENESTENRNHKKNE